MEYKKLNKKVIKSMFLGTLIQFVILTAILGAVWWFLGGILPLIVQFIMLGIVILNLLYLIISPKVRYERYRYCITTDKIDVKEGFIFTERHIVPIERLHKISIQKGPINNLFGLSDVIVTTAGGDVTIAFLEDEEANYIAESLKDKINATVASQKLVDKQSLNSESENL